jgi:hypothetical protein
MGACNLGAMICYFKYLYYDFKFLATDKYEENGCHSMIPPILLIDNSATIAMSKNYKVSSRNRHIGRRWHFVGRGQIAKYFQTYWIPAEDQIADDMTKTQTAAISMKHMNRTLIPIRSRTRIQKRCNRKQVNIYNLIHSFVEGV